MFTFNVTAPSHWVVVSNAATPGARRARRRRLGVELPHHQADVDLHHRRSWPASTTASSDTYEGKFGTIPLGHYCRQSLKEHMDTAELVELTKQSFAWFEEQFDYPYPFGKYDQLYVPEYNTGAMENAGCVTLRDEYLPRSRQPRSFFEFRTSVITHEMAHMWFGDLVTMKWWDDLWLNESFAEWACYWCEANATEFTDAWTGFANARKQTGYRADQLPSTHPIAADNVDLHAVEVNFDMITYAKGASVLKQLVAWVGLEPFLKGLRAYFKEWEYGNPEFKDLLATLEKSSGRELQGWAQEWLQTAGVNTLSPSFELGEDGTYSSFAVSQTAAPEWPTLRRHRLGIGLYDDGATGRLVRRDYLEIDVEGASTESPSWSACSSPTLLLLNDEDHAYAKIRLDERSLATAISALSTLRRLARPRARVGRGVGHDPRRRDAGAATSSTWCWPTSARRPTPGASPGSRRTPRSRSTPTPTPRTAPSCAPTWETGLRGLLLAAEPGSDHQLTFARSYAAAAHSDAALDDLMGLLDGSLSVEGLAVDQDMRWVLITALAAAGRFGDAEIDAELERDKTISGKEQAAAARVSQPTAEAKAEALGTRSSTRPRPTRRRARWSSRSSASARRTCSSPTSRSTSRRPRRVIDTLGFHKASTVLEYGFPKPLGSPDAARAGGRVAGRHTAPQGRAALRRRGAGRDRPRARRPGLRRRRALTGEDTPSRRSLHSACRLRRASADLEAWSGLGVEGLRGPRRARRASRCPAGGRRRDRRRRSSASWPARPARPRRR